MAWHNDCGLHSCGRHLLLHRIHLAEFGDIARYR